jgi:hypothetical protein
LLIPTPGQTEQEYLADYLSEKGWFTTISQKEISPSNLIFSDLNDDSVKMIRETSAELFERAIQEILDY